MFLNAHAAIKELSTYILAQQIYSFKSFLNFILRKRCMYLHKYVSFYNEIQTIKQRYFMTIEILESGEEIRTQSSNYPYIFISKCFMRNNNLIQHSCIVSAWQRKERCLRMWSWVFYIVNKKVKKVRVRFFLRLIWTRHFLNSKLMQVGTKSI